MVGMARTQRRRGVLVLLLVIAALAGSAARVAHINTRLAPKLTALASAQQAARDLVPARRGHIFDARGRLVAGSEMMPTVFVDPRQVARTPDVAAEMGRILGLPAEQIERLIQDGSGRAYRLIKRDVAPAEAAAIRELRLPGVGLADAPCRRYPLGEAMSQTLGFVSPHGEGLEGIESAYDAFLRGEDGERVTLRDARRRIICDQEGQTVHPRDGGHVVLTLDAVIQALAERELRAAVLAVEAEFGMTVVMAPETGEVLALASFPTFDPADYTAAKPENRRNRPITDAFEPGSVFKPFIMAGALQQGVVRTSESFYCHDGAHYFGQRLIHDTKPSGTLTLEGILARSSNIGMGFIGIRVGNPGLHSILTRFGFGAATHVGFPGESPGYVVPLRDWNSYSTTSVPMGHETMVSALQLATAMCALANDGVRLRPRLVKALLRPDGSVLESFDQPEVVGRAVPEGVARWMVQHGLRAVVTPAAQTDALLADYRIVGKTGTAQVPYKHRRGYEPNAYLSSFMGCAPYDDPKVVVLVMIHKPNPSLGYYGRVVSLPAARNILVGALGYLQIPMASDDHAATMVVRD